MQVLLTKHLLVTERMSLMLSTAPQFVCVSFPLACGGFCEAWHDKECQWKLELCISQKMGQEALSEQLLITSHSHVGIQSRNDASKISFDVYQFLVPLRTMDLRFSCGKCLVLNTFKNCLASVFCFLRVHKELEVGEQ